MSLKIYIGVAYNKNGGNAVVFVKNNVQSEEWTSGFRLSNVPRMYLHAIVDTANKLDESETAELFLNNTYIIDSFSKGWLELWNKGGFTKNKHADLWKKLHILIHTKKLRLTFINDQFAPHKWAVQKAKRLSLEASSKPDLPIDEAFASNDPYILENDSILIEAKAPQLEKTICVDASCTGNPGPMEYRGVDSITGEVIFQSKNYPEGTNNIGEFLAIVHALALNYERNYEWQIIYTDSMTALSWLRNKKCKTKLENSPQTEELLKLVKRAEAWLEKHTYKVRVLKWDTNAWGEIPADYNRK